MSTLPPRPNSPPRDQPDSRNPTDHTRDQRPPSYTTRNAPDSSDQHNLPPRPRVDSYVGSDSRRREYDDRNRDRNRDRDRDRGIWDRRDFRDRDRRYSPPCRDRYYRRDRSLDRGRRYPSRDRYRKRSPSPSPRRGHRRSRTPPLRRRYDSPPRRGPLSPRHRDHSPPTRGLGTRSINMSPPHSGDRHSTSRPADSTRQPHRSRSPRRPRSRSVLRNEYHRPPLKTADVKTSESETPSQPSKDAAMKPPLSYVAPTSSERRPPTASINSVIQPPREPLADRQQAEVRRELEQKPPTLDVKPLDFTAPHQPQTVQQQHPRSPPRGPRNHPKGNHTPTAPAAHRPPQQGPRRHPTGPLLPQNSHVVQPVDTQMPQPPSDPQEAILPFIPPWEGWPSLTRELDAEVARLQAHRAHLATEYAVLSKSTRRAMHDLEMAAIELHAAEARRKAADTQVEKARADVLGIDAILIESPVL